MMKTFPKFIVLLFLFIPFIQGCKDDCDDIACFTPPMTFVFDFVDRESNENLFENQTFNASEIRVVNVDDDTPIDFNFIDEDNLNLIQIRGIGWETETVNALISIGDTPIVNLVVDAERKSEDCCSFTEYNEINIQNAEFELNEATEIYTVFID